MPGYPAEDLYLKRHFIEANRLAVEGIARRGRGHRRPRRLRRAGRRRRRLPPRPQLAGGARRRRRAGDLPQEPAAQLRRLRRAALLHPRRRAGDRGHRRHPGRPDDLRGLLGRGPAGLDRGRRRRDADRQPLRLALPPRQGPRARGALRRPRPLLRHPLRLLQPGRRPGRARLRRPEPARRRPAARCSRGRHSSRRSCSSATSPPAAPGRVAEPLSDLAEVYGALVLGLRDYVAKNGFDHVGIALSGGIDSALVALLAVDALGPERVTCVVMPSPHSSSWNTGRRPDYRRQPRSRGDRDPDRGGDGRLRRGDARRRSATAASPPRTSRRGSAAT